MGRCIIDREGDSGCETKTSSVDGRRIRAFAIGDSFTEWYLDAEALAPRCTHATCVGMDCRVIPDERRIEIDENTAMEMPIDDYLGIISLIVNNIRF